jgi:RNA polymerase sigma-70 factor (ECF subfamily)
LDEAFRQYARYVGSIALGIGGRRDDIDDIVQDVFVEASRGWKSIRDPGAVKAWLARVTVRVARQRLRRRRLRYVLGWDEGYDYVDVASSSATPDQRTLLAQVYRVLDGVPVEQRVAWTLRYVHGEKLEDVAELCGCSLATAKRRIASVQAVVESKVSHG